MQLSQIRIFLIAFIFSVVLISGCRRKSDVITTDKTFTRTNGEYVIIGSIMVKTNSPLNTDEFKTFMFRENELFKIEDSDAPNSMEKFVEGAWALAKDYPNRPNGYQDIMSAMTDYQFLGKPDQARALAQEMIDNVHPKGDTISFEEKVSKLLAEQ
jgi:hypothetical protein